MKQKSLRLFCLLALTVIGLASPVSASADEQYLDYVFLAFLEESGLAEDELVVYLRMIAMGTPDGTPVAMGSPDGDPIVMGSPDADPIAMGTPDAEPIVMKCGASCPPN